jgi:membrane protein implicated in regulation of membrane protease activity
MKKYTIIVLILFAYMVGMFIWGYQTGNITGMEALIYAAFMSVVLVILWFVYRRRQQFRDERKRNRKGV